MILVLKQFSQEYVQSMKTELNEKLHRLIGRKKSNSAYLIDDQRYKDIINEVNAVKNKFHRNFEDYKMLANYDVLKINGRERLIQPKTHPNCCIKFYVSTNELFSVLHTMHLLFKHADKDLLDAELKMKFMISRGGDRLMKVGDFTFTRVQYQGDHCYWSCYTHNSHGCPAKVYTERNTLMYSKNFHNHPPTEFFV